MGSVLLIFKLRIFNLQLTKDCPSKKDIGRYREIKGDRRRLLKTMRRDIVADVSADINMLHFLHFLHLKTD